MNWQTALIFSFIGLTVIGLLVLVSKIATGIWHGQPGWIVCGLSLVAFVGWFFWNARI